LFNLFCPYGNVLKVLVTPPKLNNQNNNNNNSPSSSSSSFSDNNSKVAYVQMGDVSQAHHARGYLQGISIKNSKIIIASSHNIGIFSYYHSHNADYGRGSHNLYHDYTESPNNRFREYSTASIRNRVSPTSTLHFGNCPLNSTEEDVKAFFKRCNAPLPKLVSFFNINPHNVQNNNSVDKVKTSTYRHCLISFDNIEDATDALILSNNQRLYDITQTDISSTLQPYPIRLAFSVKQY
jgi:hypothetical protein